MVVRETPLNQRSFINEKNPKHAVFVVAFPYLQFLIIDCEELTSPSPATKFDKIKILPMVTIIKVSDITAEFLIKKAMDFDY